MSGDGLRDMSLSALATAIEHGELSSVEVTQACLEAIATRDPGLGAWLAVQPERALEQAAAADDARARGVRAPLLGVPIGVKDNFCTTDLPTTCGSRLLEGYRSPFESTPTQRLREAGAVVLGKTNMDEFGMGSSTERTLGAPCRNPLDPSRTAGGSSGGSACAVADRHCAAALGSDTGGSIRQPASFCGIVGIKPTWGRVSRYGLVAFASSLDQAGTLSRTVEDGARVLEVIAGADRHDATSARQSVPELGAAARRGREQGLRGVTLGVPTEVLSLDGMQPGVAAAVEAALAAAEREGAALREVTLPHLRYAVAAYYLVCTAEASSNLARFDGLRYGRRVEGEDLLETYARSRGEGFGAEVARRILLGTFVLSEGYQEQYYGRAQRVRTLLRRDLEAAFGTTGCDAVVMPTVPRTAFQLGALLDDPLEMYLSDILTVSANLTGLPAMSLPCGVAAEDGLPVGLQLMARAFEEARMIEVGAALEALLGGEAHG